MAQLIINIPEDKKDWVLDGMALRYGYDSSIANPLFDDQLAVDPSTNPLFIVNPQSKAAFAKETLIEHIKREVIQGYVQEQWGILTAIDASIVLT